MLKGELNIKNTQPKSEVYESVETDESLVLKVLKEDKNTYIEIVKRYEEKLSRYIKRFIWDIDDATDVLQNVFIKAYQNLNSFDDSLKFNSWIYRIAHNESVNYLKKNKKIGISFIDIDFVAPTLFAKEKSDEYVLDKEKKLEIEKVLEKLDVKYREIIVLNFFEDMSYDEISDILKIPISTVGTRVRRAKEKIKTELEKINYQNK
jgi:RNA polymerase sigma-70 factor (ECF subfamily)